MKSCIECWVIFRILEHSNHLYDVVTINLGRKWRMTCFSYLLAYSIFNMSIIIILICMWLGITVFSCINSNTSIENLLLFKKNLKQTESGKNFTRWKSCIIQLKYFRFFDWKPSSEYPLSQTQTDQFTSLLCSKFSKISADICCLTHSDTDLYLGKPMYKTYC